MNTPLTERQEEPDQTAQGNAIADVLFPMGVFVVSLVVLFIAFRKQSPEPQPKFRPAPQALSTKELREQPRDASVARELLTRSDLSKVTLQACIERLSLLTKTPPKEVSLTAIRQLESTVPESSLRRWVQVLVSLIPATERVALQNAVTSENEVVYAVFTAAAFEANAELIQTAFAGAHRQADVVRNLKAVRLVSHPETAKTCLEKIQRHILQPAINYPNASDERVLLATIETIMALPTSDEAQAECLAELAIHSLCRRACFERLNEFPLRCFKPEWTGALAASLLDDLALQQKTNGGSPDTQIAEFTRRLRSVFRGERRRRYEARVRELLGDHAFDK